MNQHSEKPKLIEVNGTIFLSLAPTFLWLPAVHSLTFLLCTFLLLLVCHAQALETLKFILLDRMHPVQASILNQI